MRKYTFVITLFSLCFFTACNKNKIKTLEQQLADKETQITDLKKEINYLQGSNTSLLDRMADLSIVSKAGAESIQESIKSLSKQYDYIENLSTKMETKDSLNLALVMNLKRSLTDINDQDVQVEVRGGKVHISISDQMLFASGSARVNSSAKRVLEKVASVINDHDDLDVLVEGHTDNVPIRTGKFKDNWDLSTQRATAVVRLLQEDYLVDPLRLTAAGRAQFDPVADNDSSSGRSANRRTEIIILPQMDQFFQLLEGADFAG